MYTKKNLAGEDDEPIITPQIHVDFITFLKNYLLQNYAVVAEYTATTVTKSTKEIYDCLQRVFPSASYTPEDVAIWLHEGGYKLMDYGGMRLEWMLQQEI